MAAEIEVHYPDGLVGYKTLSRERPLVVGSSERCDVHLDAQGVASKHFAFRWSNSRQAWRCDVVGDARGLRLNGHDTVGDVLQADDEVTLGECVFIFRDAAAAPQAAAAAGNSPAAAGNFGPPALGPVTRVTTAAVDRQYDADEYFQPLWKKKSVLLGLGSVALFGVIGAVSFVLFHGNRATKMFKDARVAFDGRLTGAARDQFRAFRVDYPKDPREGAALVLAGVADARNVLDGTQQLGEALKRMEDLVRDTEKVKAFNEPEVHNPVVETFLEIAKIGGERAKDARRKIDEAAYGVAQAALKRVEEVGCDDEKLKAEQAKMVKLLADAAQEISKEKDRLAALKAIDKALADGKPARVYDIHYELYGRHAQHKMDAELRGRRDKARAMEMEQTVFVPASGAPAPPGGAPAPARPPTNLKPGEGAADSKSVVALVAGDALFGVDSGSGKLAWHAPIGFDPAFWPLPMKEGGGLLIHRPRDNVVAMLEAATGKELWAAPIEKGALRPYSRPVVFQGRMYVAGLDPKTPGEGRLYAFNLETGKLLGYFKFPQPLAGVPVLDEKRRRLVAPGEQATTFTLNPGGNKCEGVQALDHERGALVWLPTLAGQFLFSVVKQGLDKAALHCFVLTGEEGKLVEKPIGDFAKLPGLVTKEPFLRGQRLFITTDQDAFLVFDLNGEEDEKPLNLVARSVPVGDNARAAAKDSPYPLAPDQRTLWMVGRTLRKYELRNNELEPRVAFQVTLPGPPTQPPLLDQGTLVLVARDGDAGGVVAMAFNTADNKERWRMTVAAPPKSVQRDPRNPNALLVAFAGAGPQTLEIADLEKPGAMALPPIPEGAEFAEDRDVVFRNVPGWTDGVVQWPGVGGNLLRAYPPGKPERLIKLSAKIVAPPGVFGKGLLVPTSSGLVSYLDPLTGADLAEPFGVAFEDGQPVPFGPAVGATDTTFALAAGISLLRVQRIDQPFVHFKEVGRIDLPDALGAGKHDPAEVRERLAATQLARIGDKLLLATGPRLHRISAGDFVVEQSWKLAGQCFVPPEPLGALAVFVTDRRELVALGAEAGQPAEIRWRAKLNRRPLSGLQPDGADGFWLAYADGAVVRHDAGTGKPQKSLDARRPLAGGPWLVADRLVVQTPDGGLAPLAK